MDVAWRVVWLESAFRRPQTVTPANKACSASLGAAKHGPQPHEAAGTISPGLAPREPHLTPIDISRSALLRTSSLMTRSLCETCRHVRIVTTPKGSRFVLCTRSTDDARFAKYPPLPVVRCVGFELIEPPSLRNEKPA